MEDIVDSRVDLVYIIVVYIANDPFCGQIPSKLGWNQPRLRTVTDH